MSLDQRLRDEFEQEAARIEPQTARHLTTIEARARRHLSSVSLAALMVAALVIALGVLVRIGTSTSNPSVGAPQQRTAGSSQADYGAIAGTYSVTLEDSDVAVQTAGEAGAWSMTLHSNGVLDLRPPSGFRLGGASPSGAAFSVSGDRLRTNLFFNEVCNSVGSYTWQVDAGNLILVVVDDTCSVRSTLLATEPWVGTP
jgi:hypothetical protein